MLFLLKCENERGVKNKTKQTPTLYVTVAIEGGFSYGVWAFYYLLKRKSCGWYKAALRDEGHLSCL